MSIICALEDPISLHVTSTKQTITVPVTSSLEFLIFQIYNPLHIVNLRNHLPVKIQVKRSLNLARDPVPKCPSFTEMKILHTFNTSLALRFLFLDEERNNLPFHNQLLLYSLL